MTEMVLQKPLFSGRNTMNQFELLFSYLKVPNEIQLGSEFEEIKKKLNPNRTRNLADEFREQNEDYIDLLEKILEFDSMKRISASEALKHQYFDSIREQEEDEIGEII